MYIKPAILQNTRSLHIGWKILPLSTFEIALALCRWKRKKQIVAYFWPLSSLMISSEQALDIAEVKSIINLNKICQ